jgi:hypothetical protein
MGKPIGVSVQNLGDASNFGGGSSDGAALLPATSTCTSPPHWAAAVTVLRVAPLMDALSCSAITREVI